MGFFFFRLWSPTPPPAALVKAISVNPRVTGTASGLYGSIQMAVGAALVALAGLGANPALASALVLLGAGVVAQASFWVARNGSPALIERESEAAA
jgi:MFS transporter, DHA1 family, multidrug resistance protein